jgi:hypothetical protein
MIQSTIIILVVMMVLAALFLSKGSGFVGGSEVEEGVPPILVADVPFMKCVPPISTELANKHHGQRKLFIAELDLLTRAVSEYGCKYFVYAGSAPGIHIGRFMSLFPSLTFVLIDPNEFTIVVDGEVINYTPSDERAVYLSSGTYDAYRIASVDGPKMIRGIDGKVYHRGSLPVTDDYVKTIHENPGVRIFIIEELMTRELARHLKGLSDGGVGGDGVVFMSDIRTNSGDTVPTDGDMLWNMAQMFVWVSEMQPLIFSHKHRPVMSTPIILDYMRDDIAAAKELGLDLLGNPNRYLAGDAYLQAWTSKHSSETRLVGMRQNVSGGDERSCGYLHIPDDYQPSSSSREVINSYVIDDIDPIDYDQRMVYQNRINRGSHVYVHPAKHVHGIDGCYDCALEAVVWERYYRSLGIIPTQMMVTNDMLNLSKDLIVDYKGDIDDVRRLHKKTHRTKRNTAINTSAVRLLSLDST